MTGRHSARRPFLLECDDAVERMLDAIADRKRAYSFPWPLATLARAGQWFPRALYDRLLSSRR